MVHVYDLVFSKRDAGLLAQLLAEHRHANALEAEAAEALGDLMMEARFVADGTLPPGCVGLGSRVTYADTDGSAVRSVTLVLPHSADAAAGRISVLSPVGLALIGRRRGAFTEAHLPNGRRLALRVIDAVPPRRAAAEARLVASA